MTSKFDFSRYTQAVTINTAALFNSLGGQWLSSQVLNHGAAEGRTIFKIGAVTYSSPLWILQDGTLSGAAEDAWSRGSLGLPASYRQADFTLFNTNPGATAGSFIAVRGLAIGDLFARIVAVAETQNEALNAFLEQRDANFLQNANLLYSKLNTALTAARPVDLVEWTAGPSSYSTMRFTPDSGTGLTYAKLFQVRPGLAENQSPYVFKELIGTTTMFKADAKVHVVLSAYDDNFSTPGADLGFRAGLLRIDGGAGHDTLSFTAGGYSMRHMPRELAINGGSGNDTITFSTRDRATIAGGTGDDFILGEDVSFGADGRSQLYGGAGNDTIAGPPRGVTQIFGGDGNDVLSSNGALTRIHGEAGHDSLMGSGRNDTLFGGSGNDEVAGGWAGGHDLLYGGTGNDSVYGMRGNDLLYGDAGNDTLEGDLGMRGLGGGRDTLVGGAGADTFQFSLSFGRDVVSDFTRSDKLRIATGQAYTAEGVISNARVLADGIEIRLGANRIFLDGLTSLDILNGRIEMYDEFVY